VTALEVLLSDGQTKKMIVRQHGAVEIAEGGLDDATEKTMRERHGWFVTQAIEKLSVQGI
jgi:hypothetical protein